MTYPINLRSKIFYVPLILGSLVASFYLLGIIFGFLANFSSLFEVIIFAYLISIVLKPLVDYLQKRGVNKIVSIVLSFLLLLIILVGVGIFVFPSLFSELSTISNRITNLDLNSLAEPYLKNFHLQGENLTNTFVSHIDAFISYTVNNSIAFLGNVFGVFFDLVLSFFFAFYFLLEGGKWKDEFVKLIPDNLKGDAVMIIDSINEGVQSFIQGQAIISLIMAVAVIIVMKILGLNLILVAGLYVFVSMMIPVVGPVICVIVPLLLAATVSLPVFILTGVILFVLSQIVVNIIQPKVFSQRLGIHPVIVVISVLVGAQLFGVVGALLALPFASIVQSLLIHYYKYL